MEDKQGKKSAPNPHAGHRQRMYQRFLREGLAGFDEHQALELLLFFSCPRIDPNELAPRIIDTFGSMSAAMDAPVEDLMRVPGVGNTSAVLLKTVPQMCAYYLENRKAGKVPLRDATAMAEYFLPKFYGKNTEHLYMAALNDDLKPLRCILLAEGTSNRVNLVVPKVVGEASRAGASAVILAHNHPSGSFLPSDADVRTTEQTGRALQALGIRLLDHLIFCEEEFVSFRSTSYRHYLPDHTED